MNPVDGLPVHELSAVNGHSLRFKYRRQQPFTFGGWSSGIEHWHTPFPKAQLWGPPEDFARVFPYHFRRPLTGHSAGSVSRDLEQLVFKGNSVIEEVEFLTQEVGCHLPTENLATVPWKAAFMGFRFAHGACVEHDAKAFVENAFRWFKPLTVTGAQSDDKSV
jgi:hypothetical protein